MELSPQSLSVYVTVFLTIAAVLVALIVDYLKGNNERLRELAIELKAKQDAAERTLHVLEVHTNHLMQHPVLVAAAPIAQQPQAAMASASPQPQLNEQKQAPGAVHAPENSPLRRPAANPDRPRREMSPAVAAVAESVAARMAAQQQQPKPMNPVNAPPVVKPVVVEEPPVVMAAATAVPPPMPVDVPVVAEVAAEAPAPKVTVVPEVVPVQVKTGEFKPVADGRKDWSRILSSRKQDKAPSVTPVEPVVIDAGNLIQFDTIRVPAATVVVDDSAQLPAGFHDYALLRKVCEAGATIPGMVVAIGVNALDAPATAEVSQFLQSLLEPTDFACQSANDEFVLVAMTDPMSGQRRLSTIAEKLWDFQLRALGRFNVQFSWGGMEARPADKINDIVAAAIDQMKETRAARRSNTVHIAKAV